MKVILAEHAGTCFGVERALTLADDALSGGRAASSLGPLIHNPGVVQDLTSRGMFVADSVADIRTDVVVIRSHGVTPAEFRALAERGADVVDATCPFVTRAQRAARRLGETFGTVIVVGEAGHPEVEALCAYVRESGARAIVAATPDELADELAGTVGVVVQTTQRASVLDGILEALRARGVEFELADTICNATAERQDAALALARTVDAMVVVGGRHSSNTTRLAEICALACPRVFHIEEASELVAKDFVGCDAGGLTAGASTPDSQIARVLDTLRGF